MGLCPPSPAETENRNRRRAHCRRPSTAPSGRPAACCGARRRGEAWQYRGISWHCAQRLACLRDGANSVGFGAHRVVLGYHPAPAAAACAALSVPVATFEYCAQPAPPAALTTVSARRAPSARALTVS